MCKELGCDFFSLKMPRTLALPHALVLIDSSIQDGVRIINVGFVKERAAKHLNVGAFLATTEADRAIDIDLKPSFSGPFL